MRPGVSGLVTRNQAAELVGVRPHTISTWVARGHLSRSPYVGKHGEPLYISDDVYAAERGRRRRQPSRTMRRRSAS